MGYSEVATMRMILPWKWENLDEHTMRAKVAGGWVIHHLSFNGHGNLSESMIFLTDPNHEWKIEAEQPDVKVEQSSLAKDFEVPTA